MGGTWLVPTGDDAEAMEEMDSDMGYGLTSYWTTMDMGDADTCDMMLDMMEEDEGFEGECDGSELSVTMSYSDVCDNEDDDDACDMATGGMIGAIGMWAGIICALVLTLTLALPMAGVDAMDNLPDMAKTITMWGAGALMLLGMLGWYHATRHRLRNRTWYEWMASWSSNDHGSWCSSNKPVYRS